MAKREFVDGQFCWVDLSARDAGLARRFYQGLFGWDVVGAPADGHGEYAFLMKDGEGVGGLGELTAEMKANGVPPTWNNYVQVSDAQATLDRAVALGATVVVPVVEVGGHGHLAYLADPTGAVVALWQSAPREGDGPGTAGGAGSFCWHELLTRDPDRAKAFYSELFGWSYREDPAGPYTYTSATVQGRSVGGLMPMEGPEWEGIPPHWMTYFAVADCDASAAEASRLGGEVRVPPTDIPGVGRFAVLADPQGAVFSILQFTEHP